MAKYDPLMRAGHRERLRKKFDAGNASDNDEMELLLTYIVARRDVRIPARLLMEKFGSAYNAMVATPEDIKSVPGVGDGVATFFKLLHSIVSKGYRQRDRLESVIINSARLQEYCRMHLANKPTEEMHVMYLDNMGRLLCTELNDVGTVNRSNVYPDKILARALMSGASRVVLFHNHPVGDCSASNADVDMTLALGRILLQHNITIYDHLIIDSYGLIYSMRTTNVLDELDRLAAELRLEQIRNITNTV